MYAERGGSNTFARYAFNELISFIAGWAVLIDYIIIVAIAAITVPHYLTPIAPEFGEAGGEIIVAAAVIVGVAIANVIGSTGALRRRLYVVIALADFALQVAVVVVGALVVFDPRAAHRPARPLHVADALGRDLRGGDRDGRARGDRGGVGPRAGPRLGRARPQARGQSRAHHRSDPLRGDRRDRADGGAGGPGPRRPADCAGRRVQRGADPRRGAELRPGVGRRHDAMGGRAGRPRGPDLGREHLDAGSLAPRLHTRDEPPDPELARKAGAADRHAVHRDLDRRGDRARAR